MMPSNELAASVQPPNEVNNLEEGRRVEIIDDDNENQPVPFGDMVEADRRSEAEYLKAREYHNNNAIATATATLSTQNRPNSDMSLDFNEIAHPTSSPNHLLSLILPGAKVQEILTWHEQILLKHLPQYQHQDQHNINQDIPRHWWLH